MTGRAALGEDNGLCVRGCNHTGTRSDRPGKFARLRRAKGLAPELHRFQLCNDATRRGTMRQLGVSIYAKGQTAYYQGVLQCGSVWVCPVCAPRIAERRRAELQEAINNTIRKECGVILVTLTFPHGAGDDLPDILERQSRALRYFKGGRAANAMRKSIAFMGEVRTLEVTHGEANGWHPHTHALWFTGRKLTEAELARLFDDIYPRWVSACLKAGLPEPSRAHGVDIRGARYAGEYVAKWGFATELAGQTRKRGKLSGRTPWQLLEDTADGDKRAAWLWREFALAFFGKRQLNWSKGLRKQLELAPELTEQQLLELDDERAHQVILLDLDTWYVVRKASAHDEVLRLAVESERDLIAFLNHLRSTVGMEDGRPPGPREDWEL